MLKPRALALVIVLNGACSTTPVEEEPAPSPSTLELGPNIPSREADAPESAPNRLPSKVQKDARPLTAKERGELEPWVNEANLEVHVGLYVDGRRLSEAEVMRAADMVRRRPDNVFAKDLCGLALAAMTRAASEKEVLAYFDDVNAKALRGEDAERIASLASPITGNLRQVPGTELLVSHLWIKAADDAKVNAGYKKAEEDFVALAREDEDRAFQDIWRSAFKERLPGEHTHCADDESYPYGTVGAPANDLAPGEVAGPFEELGGYQVWRIRGVIKPSFEDALSRSDTSLLDEKMRELTGRLLGRHEVDMIYDTQRVNIAACRKPGAEVAPAQPEATPAE